MCGRFTQYRAWQEMHEFYTLLDAPQNLAPRYNIAPTDMVGVIRAGDHGRTHSMMRWWLVPLWWKKRLKDVPPAFNARAEEIAHKPLFRGGFRDRRCIVWADGFYEWRHQGKAKLPFYITRVDGAPMSLAGLWESWTNPEDGERIRSCTIITCPANARIRELHDRMPVVLEKPAIDRWLTGDSGTELLVPCAEDILEVHEVSSAVNSSRYDQPDCIVPVVPDHQGQLKGDLFGTST